MKTETKITKITCDICGKETQELQVHEGMQALILGFSFYRYYGNNKEIKDVCETCNIKIMERVFDCMSGKFIERK